MQSRTPPGANPFVEHLGVQPLVVSHGHAEIKLAVRHEHLNGLGVAHGGVVMTLLDVVMAVAAKSADPDQMGMVTVEIKTTFMRPAKGDLHALGWCDHFSTTMAFCRGELRDSQGRLLAQSMGTFKRMRSFDRRRASGAD